MSIVEEIIVCLFIYLFIVFNASSTNRRMLALVLALEVLDLI